MPSNLSSLRKVLELESKKGYLDSSVIGGLDRFLRQWSNQAIESLTSPKFLRQFKKLKLDKPDYTSMDREQRQQWLKNVLGFLVDVESGGSTKSETKTIHAILPPPRHVWTVSTSLESPITVVRGISDSLASRFNKLGVKTVHDLLYFFPQRHLDYSQRKTISQLTEGKEETIMANVWEVRLVTPGGRRSTEAIVGDETGNVRIVWFNNPYLAKTLRTNAQIIVSGRVSLFNGRHVFQSPEWESFEDKELIHTGRLVPIYHLTAGLYPRQIRKLMKAAIDQWAGQAVDFLPSDLRERQRLLELPQAIRQAHFPENETAKARARSRPVSSRRISDSNLGYHRTVQPRVANPRAVRAKSWGPPGQP